MRVPDHALTCQSVEADAGVILKGRHDLPTTSAAVPTPCIDWTYIDRDEAKEWVLSGQSLYISGIAGTGKSHLMKELVAALKEQGERVEIMAKCHVAALSAGGHTANAFIHTSSTPPAATQRAGS